MARTARPAVAFLASRFAEAKVELSEPRKRHTLGSEYTELGAMLEPLELVVDVLEAAFGILALRAFRNWQFFGIAINRTRR